MVTDNIGLNKQSTGENNGKWGDVLNANLDKISSILSCLITQSATDRKVLHVLPTDAVGNPVIKDSLVQPKEITSPSFEDIIDGLIGDNDQSYPTSGQDIMIFANIEGAILRAADLATAGFKCDIMLHPGVHVVQSDITIPPGTTIVGLSKASCSISLVAANLAIKYSNSSVRNVVISGNAGCYVLAQPLALTALENCEIVDCKISIPFYMDCKNIPSAIDLFVKGCEFLSSVVFVNSVGNVVTLGSVAMSGNYIGKNSISISDTVGDIGTALGMMIQDTTISVDAISKPDALLKSIKNIAASSVDYVAYQTAVATLYDNYYHLSGMHGSVSMGTPYPIMENNIYA